MAERLFDVNIEFNLDALHRKPDPTRTIAEVCRHSAEVMCDKHGMVLTDPEPRELTALEGINRENGRSVLVVASRWRANQPAGGPPPDHPTTINNALTRT